MPLDALISYVILEVFKKPRAPDRNQKPGEPCPNCKKSFEWKDAFLEEGISCGCQFPGLKSLGHLIRSSQDIFPILEDGQYKVVRTGIEGYPEALNAMGDYKRIQDYEWCPHCGQECSRDSVDIGVGMMHGPWGCECGWSEDERYDCRKGPKYSDGHKLDQWGSLYPNR